MPRKTQKQVQHPQHIAGAKLKRRVRHGALRVTSAVAGVVASAKAFAVGFWTA